MAVTPLFFLLAGAVGFGMLKASSTQRGFTDAPGLVVAMTVVLTTVIFLVPCAGAVVYGGRACGAGDSRGRLPVVIGWMAAGVYVGLNVLAFLIE